MDNNIETDNNLKVTYENTNLIIQALNTQTSSIADKDKSSFIWKTIEKIWKTDFLLKLSDEDNIFLEEYIKSAEIIKKDNIFKLSFKNIQIDIIQDNDLNDAEIYFWVTHEITNDEMYEIWDTENDRKRLKIIVQFTKSKWYTTVYISEKEILNWFKQYLRSININSAIDKNKEDVKNIVK